MLRNYKTYYCFNYAKTFMNINLLYAELAYYGFEIYIILFEYIFINSLNIYKPFTYLYILKERTS